MTFGQAIKQIRSAKGLSQEELSQGIMSRSNLSRFETGDYYPSYDKVIGIIERLELSLEEILYIANDYQPNEVAQLYQQLVESENQYAQQEIESISIEAKERYQQTGNAGYQRIYVFAQLALNQLGVATKELDKREIEQLLLPYFTEKEEWYINDLRYLNNCLAVFDIEDACFIANRALKNFEKYQNFKSQTNIQTNLMINIGTRCFEQGAYKESQRYFQKAKEYSTSFNHLYNQVICAVYLGILTTNPEEAQLGHYFVVLEELGYHETVNYLKEQRRFMKQTTNRSV